MCQVLLTLQFTHLFTNILSRKHSVLHEISVQAYRRGRWRFPVEVSAIHLIPGSSLAKHRECSTFLKRFNVQHAGKQL